MKHQSSSRRSIGILLGLAAAAVGIQACGSGGGTTSTTTGGLGGDSSTTTVSTNVGGAGGGKTTSGTGGSSVTSTASASTAGAGGAGGGSATTTTASGTTTSGTTTTATASASSGAGGAVACTEITANAFQAAGGDLGNTAGFRSIIAPNIGDATMADRLAVEFYGSTYDAANNGETKGSFDLSAAGDNHFSTCSRCVRVLADPLVPGKLYFQQSGTMLVDPASDQINGTVNATITDLTLVEVTIDDVSGDYVPVPGGECLHLATATLMVAPPVVPAKWLCDAGYYSDGTCDCGCGVIDPDCESAAIGVCEFCDDTGSCSTDACPGTIAPADNATCTP